MEEKHSEPLKISRRQKKWVRALVRRFSDVEPLLLLGSVVDRIANFYGTSLDASSASAVDFSEVQSPPRGWGDIWLVGLVHEQAVSSGSRVQRGAWYTPESVVRGLVSFSLSLFGDDEPEIILDPTCGGGAFLLAALDELNEKGVGPAVALTKVKGMDIDAGAVQAARWSLLLWGIKHDVKNVEVETSVQSGNALVDAPESWGQKRIVVGNPPFASPLKSGTLDGVAIAFQERNSQYLGMYADLASMHLLRAVQTSAEGSVIVMVQPQSILSSRDLLPLRKYFSSDIDVVGLWVARERLFDASVRACAPVVRIGSSQDGVQLASGATVMPGKKVEDASWSDLAASALGAPDLSKNFNTVQTLGELVTATAGFRDEYYGLKEACVEHGQGAEADKKILTVGAVDPLWHAWGTKKIKFGGKQWRAPVVDSSLCSERTRRWVERQQEPKILLATQARVLEPVIDYNGSLISVTPLLVIEAPFEELFRVAAVFLSPPVVLWAWRKWFGSAMSVDSIKLSAKQVLELPLPVDESCWDEAAALLKAVRPSSEAEAQETSAKVAEIMNEAYASEIETLRWWQKRFGL